MSQKMYTTMDCDFLEIEFFFQIKLSGQGENTVVDPLRQLLSLVVSETIPTEQVGETPEPVSEHMVQPVIEVSSLKLSFFPGILKIQR